MRNINEMNSWEGRINHSICTVLKERLGHGISVIVGLRLTPPRSFTEQTLGRGLRRMYRGTTANIALSTPYIGL